MSIVARRVNSAFDVTRHTFYFAFRMAVDEWLDAHRRGIEEETAAKEQRIDSQTNAIMRCEGAEPSENVAIV
jgi:hypothetical protein